MKSPFTGKEMSIATEWRSMVYRNDEFKILFHYFQCDETGEKFEDEDFARLNYIQLINQYREKNNIPFTEQIIDLRKKYRLPASKMSEILGFGTNSYRQYEKGEIPSHSNSRLIQLAQDPGEFKKLLSLNKSLYQKTIDKTLRTIEGILTEEIKREFERQFEQYLLGSCMPNSFTGYKCPSLTRFSNMVAFFAEKLQPWKTKLNKLLFYSDFLMFKHTGYSISGAQYRAIPLGPVPNNYQSIYEYLATKNLVDITYNQFPDGGTGEMFRANPDYPFKSEIFTPGELEILETVLERFKDASTNEIIEISHQEKAWIENKDERKLINYNYGFALN